MYKPYVLEMHDAKNNLIGSSSCTCLKDFQSYLGRCVLELSNIDSIFKIKSSHVEKFNKETKYSCFLDYLDELISIGDYLLIFELDSKLYKISPGRLEE